MARVVAGGVVDEAVVAVQLERAPADPHAAAHGHRRLLARPHVAAPVRRDDLHARALVELQIEHAADPRATAAEPHAAAALERASRPAAPPPTSAAERPPRARRPRTASARGGTRPRSASASAAGRRAAAPSDAAAVARPRSRTPRAAYRKVAHRRRSTLQIDWSVNRPGEVRVRAAAVQLQSTTDTERNLASAERLVRAAAARRRRARRAPRAARHPRRDVRLPRRRRAARRPPDRRGRASLRASWASTSSPARSPSAARATSASRTRPCTSAPTARSAAVYRKIHMFDVEVGGTVYRESEHSEPARRDRPLGDRERRPARAHHLLRPALPRAVPHPRAARRARHHGACELHARHRRGALGGPAARPRDREPGVRDRAGPGSRARPGGRQLRQLDDRRPVGRGPRAAPGDGRAVLAADLDLARQDEIREKLPSLANRVEARVPLAGRRSRA